MASRQLTVAEANLIGGLIAPAHLWGAHFELSNTQLDKSTIDASSILRDVFARSGLHSYADQGRGREHRVSRPAVVLLEGQELLGEVGFLRPRSGNGDPRFWLPALHQVRHRWAFGDAVACVTDGRKLALMNLTKEDFDTESVERLFEGERSRPLPSLGDSSGGIGVIGSGTERQVEMNDQDVINLTPSPAILEAMTYAPLAWLDGISELIDNSLDGFAAAIRLGHRIENPVIEIFIPTRADVERGRGRVMIRDNGPGLTRDELRRALTAGTSGNQRYGAMGLFGVGFNISTGKLGSITKVSTRKIGGDRVITATIDLRQMRERGSYDVPVTDEHIDDTSFPTRHGTTVEVSEWWPKGHPNAEYALSVAQQSQRIVSENLGRRYATVLRGDTSIGPVTFLLYPEETQQPDSVEPFHHCVWAANREVRRKEGSVPAQIHFDQVLQTRRRCLGCQVQVPSTDDVRCPSCGSDQIRSIDERVRGWVGIQRFDDSDDYGIDLIRNGRLIQRSEKVAFFHWTDPSDGINRREYPVDDQTGRIVGEVHLDHVPVDYNKQHFESISTEWVSAVEFLRGKALRPKSWPEGYRNESPVARLSSAYKRIRSFGREDMYMGRWVDGQFKRVTRDFERELRDRFNNREEGYFDDEEWWKHVELGDSIPSAHKECPHCATEYLHSPERCPNCFGILLGKPCRQCAAQIALSDQICGGCGADQSTVNAPIWDCAYCLTSNPSTVHSCSNCGRTSGSAHPADPEVLEQQGELLEEYSRPSITVSLPNGRRSDVLDLRVFSVGEALFPIYGGPRVPLIRDSSQLGSLKIFIDLDHPVFLSGAVSPEFLLSVEAANYFRSRYGEMVQSFTHSVSALSSLLLTDFWAEQTSATAEQLNSTLSAFFEDIAERLTGSESATQFFKDLRPYEQQEIYGALFKARRTADASELIESGRFIDLMPRQYLVKFFEQYPDLWLERVFPVVLPRADQVGEERAKRYRERLLAQLARALADCADVVDSDDVSGTEKKRAELSYRMLIDAFAGGA